MNISNYKYADFSSDLKFEINENISKDEKYWEFIRNIGDGYFFNRSLHVFGNSHIYKEHDLENRTLLVKNFYSKIIDVSELISFGEDVFGNQFIFYPNGIGLLNIETAEIEFIAKDFSKWLEEVVERDTEYLTGMSLMLEWDKENKSLKSNERLRPKIPFILGGEYQISNLYKCDFKDLIEFNSDLAQQISDLPDGAKISIEFE